jgi:hypothetical protein
VLYARTSSGTGLGNGVKERTCSGVTAGLHVHDSKKTCCCGDMHVMFSVGMHTAMAPVHCSAHSRIGALAWCASLHFFSCTLRPSAPPFEPHTQAWLQKQQACAAHAAMIPGQCRFGVGSARQHGKQRSRQYTSK